MNDTLHEDCDLRNACDTNLLIPVEEALQGAARSVRLRVEAGKSRPASRFRCNRSAWWADTVLAVAVGLDTRDRTRDTLGNYLDMGDSQMVRRALRDYNALKAHVIARSMEGGGQR